MHRALRRAVRRASAVTAAVALAAASLVLAAASTPTPAAADDPPPPANPSVFGCSEESQYYYPPDGAYRLLVEVAGAEGGTGFGGTAGGKGGRLSAVVPAAPGTDEVEVHVGCAGDDAQAIVPGTGGDGWGDGGHGGLAGKPGGGGGGSSAVLSAALGLQAVAGGGGGGGDDVDQSTTGGAGGGADQTGNPGGEDQTGCAGGGGTLVGAGAGGTPPPSAFSFAGAAGVGASGGDAGDQDTTTIANISGGGGGGGFFGGGGGGTFGEATCGGGGGGSGFVTASAEEVSVGGAGQQAGDGSIRITVLATFSDVPYGHAFFGDVEWMAFTEISTGYADGTYKPAAPVSRQAMSAFMFRLAGASEVPVLDEPTFSDVPEDHPFYDEIEWMNAEGITTGYPDGTFKPAAPVSRQAMSAFMFRLADEPTYPDPEGPSFSDVPEDHPFYDEVEWMAFAGISTGYPDGTYKPAAAVSRQAMSAFMHRFASEG